MPVSLKRDDAHIWYRFTESLDDSELMAAVSVLSAEERARYDRFVFARDRRDFAAAHALLRSVLSMYEEVPPSAWTFGVSPSGKPFLEPGQARTAALAFNLSHTHGLVACTVARAADVGIDVESTERLADAGAIAGRYFSADERVLLDRCADQDRAARFTELWTLKEAYIKATGQGLTQPLHEFAFGFDGAADIQFHAPRDTSATAWWFALFVPSARYRLAVAIRSEQPRQWRLTAGAVDAAGALVALRTSGASRVRRADSTR